MTAALLAVLMVSTTVTFDDVKPIFKQKCSLCHQYFPRKNWDKYENAYIYRDKIVEQIKKDTMPPKGVQPRLTQKEKDLIKEWVRGGAKR